MGADDDHQRFQVLYQRCWQPVFAYVLRRSADHFAAEDVVAEVFATAWRRLADVPEGRELPWLYGVARNTLSNSRRGQLRRARLTQRYLDHTLTIGDLADAPEDDAAQLERLRIGLAQLDDTELELLRLAVWEGLTHVEIAEVVRTTESAVTGRLHRARRKVAQIVARDEWPHEGKTIPKSGSS